MTRGSRLKEKGSCYHGGGSVDCTFHGWVKRRRSADESWMYEEHLDGLVRHWRIELRQVDADGNWSKNSGWSPTSDPRPQMILRPITMNSEPHLPAD